MISKAIKPVEGAAKSAAISKYSPDRQSGERGRRQQSSDSYKPKPDKQEPKDFDKFFASTDEKPSSESSEFERLLKKMWEENARMQKTAKATERAPVTTATPIQAAYILEISSGYRLSAIK